MRVLKRLRAAVGYHELGMTPHALRCLDSLTSLGKIEPFGLVSEVLRDEFIANRGDRIPVANALQIVACMLPTPARRAVQMTLAACCGSSGIDRTTSNRGVACRVVPVDQAKPAR